MSFVSYAQNFEDVLLWRALGQVENGFYIDVGAFHPDTDSVTRAFYDHGWRGINVEPGRAAFARLAAARPRDINLPVAAGAVAGCATFHAVEGADAGLSTTDAAAASRYRAEGRNVQTGEVAVRTLADICRQHAAATIHFLKIDVEGAERAVLEGADFTSYRPWIVLVEATAPMTTAEVHGAWEDILLGAGYRFVWFDGLNRFYVASERHDWLAPSFRTPPNVFDDFIRAGDSDSARRALQAEAGRAAVLARAQLAERRASTAEERAEAAYLRLAQRAAAEARAVAEIARLREALVEAKEQADAQVRAVLERTEAVARQNAKAHEWLAAMRHSTSWRVTAPLRRIMRRGARSGAPELPAIPAPPLQQPATPSLRPAPAPARIRAVHQFHSGSAFGDAITNAMIMTRDLLRGLGYDSRIFVEHRDPACGDALHLMDELPPHDRYALLLGHSMGYDALPEILALPAPKVLVYHNITPPELLSDLPALQDYARLGRAQLAELRPAVAAALAVSEYNALELRQAGFDPVESCNLLFDIDAMLARAPVPRRGAAFTILFVGRVIRSKGQHALIEAYARFRELYAGESRLVLVGRHGGEDDPYLVDLRAGIRRHKLDGAVEITGLVSDAELLRRYAEADLYVSLSQHEGFGVPLVEAMAYGVPVLAWPAGGIPYTLGEAAALLDDTTPEAVAERILELATRPGRRAAIAERQRRSLDRFRLERQLPALFRALDRAGVARPPDPAARDALAANMRFTVAGHVNGTYSLAEVNRAFAAALEAGRPGHVRLLAVEGDVTTRVADIPESQRDRVRSLLSRGPHPTAPEVVISQHYPVWVPPHGDVSLALFFWEESLIPPETAATLTQHFDGVLAPARTVAKALIDSGVQVPVRVLGLAPDLERFHRLRATRLDRPRDPDAPFTFLHVSSCFPRKGIDLLLAAYAGAFRRADRVRLVIKGFPNPHSTVADQVARILADPDAPAIELIDRDLEESALLGLYAAADAMVLPSRGEGYNMPAAEALAAGLPLILTGYGGHMDFVGAAPPGAVRLLAYAMAPALTHLATPFSLWAEPDEADLRAALREAVQRGPWIVPEFAAGQTDLAARVSRFAAERLLAPKPEAPSIAWVTTWDVRCGIAEYSQHLLEHMPAGGVVLADGRTGRVEAEGSRRVIPAWTLGDPASLRGLIREILRHDPAIVVIQHQPGLMQWGMLARLLTASALQGRVVCVALHSTKRLLDVDAVERDGALRAMQAVSRIVVHTVQDMNFLAGLGLAGNVTLLPHGTPEEAPPEIRPVRALTENGPALIGCYGFFLPEKGIPELVQALAILRRRWPQAKLRLVNAEYPARDSLEEIARARETAAQAGVTDAVEFVTGFLEHQQSRALLADCDLIVLPYRNSKEGSSAALRSALTARVPVAVTPLPLFDEAGAAVMVLPGQGPAAMADGIAAALLDRPARQAAVAAAGTWMGDRSWPKTARRWDAMLRGLFASGIVLAG